MDIIGVHDIIHKIAEGFEDNALQCLGNHSSDVVDLIQEQIYNGQDGDGEYLSPTYDEDPFFDEPGRWHGRADDYIKWKYEITPPVASPNLCLSPRPIEVPNLFIDGTLFGQISAIMKGTFLEVSPGNGNGPEIKKKYGDRLFMLGEDAVEWFNLEYMWPAIEKFFNDCGYR